MFSWSGPILNSKRFSHVSRGAVARLIETTAVTRAPSPSRSPSSPRAARTGGLRLLLALVLLLQGLAALAPGMWIWGANAFRFLPPWGWAVWLAGVLLLVPALARPLLPALRRLGDLLAARPGAAAAALVGAVAVLLLPDRTRLVGDFLLRQGGTEESLSMSRLFPQALPLDVWLHDTLPTWAKTALGVAPALASRTVGAADAALTAWLAVLFARRLGAAAERLPAVAAVAGCGAWLALFTGYSKAFAEMSVLVLATAVTGLDALRGRRSAVGLAVLVSAGLFLHRSALALLPAAAFVFFASRSGPARPAGRGAAFVRIAAPLLPLVALALVGPRIWGAAGAYDLPHFAGREGGGGFLPALLSPLHLLDVGNLVLFLVPLSPLAVLALRRPGSGGEPRRRAAAPGRASASVAGPTGREWAFLVLLAAPLAGLLLVVHPAQGPARDFDVFAPAGVALALLLAALVEVRLRSAAAWLAPAVLLAAAAPVAGYLAVQADLDRGLARAVALAEGPPARPDHERAKLHEFLGSRLYRAGRLREAVRHYERAARFGPSPNIVMGWALVAGYAGDRESEERACRLLLERARPDQREFLVHARTRLAAAALARGDTASAREHSREALRLDPTTLSDPTGAHGETADTVSGGTARP